jgi:GGDEF domain-containing protein
MENQLVKMDIDKTSSPLHTGTDTKESPLMQTPSLEHSLTLLQDAPVGMAILDDAGKLTWCNKALASLAGMPTAELIGLAEANLLEAAEDDAKQLLFPASHRRVQRSVSALDQGQAVFYLDVTERDSLAQQLRQHNTVEPVSGLLNAQAISASLDPLVSRSRRYQNPLSVVTMAIANLPAAADEPKAVVAVSHLLRDQLRWADILGRDEEGRFLLVLPETDKDAAIALVNKISDQLDALEIAAGDVGAYRPRACFGVAQWLRGNDTSLLLKRSAEAFAAASQQGGYAVAAG